MVESTWSGSSPHQRRDSTYTSARHGAGGAAWKRPSPLGQPARPEEAASGIAFLASAEAGFVNGVVLPVDGGVTASNGQPNMGITG